MIADKYTIREQNEAIVLTNIINHSKISRSAVSKRTGLNKASISEIVKKLMNDQIIDEIGIGSGSSSGGRKPILLQLNKHAGVSLGIDVGYDYVSSMLTYLNGEILKEKRTTGTLITKENVVEIIKDIIESYTHLATELPYKIVGVTIAIHGIVFENNILFTPYYNLDKINLFKDLSKITDIPIHLENEANLTALAESTFSSKKNNLVSVSINSGIGAGIVMNGYLYGGLNGRSGEIGHMTLYPHGLACPCGNHGCFEQYCSEKSIMNQFQSLKNDFSLSIDDLVLLFERNDEQSLNLINKFIDNLSIGINNLIATFGPEIIYINSSLTRKIPCILPTVKDKMVSSFNKDTPLYESQLGTKASLLGATALAIKNFLKVDYLDFRV
ncbi:ROK family transcriptional regulator [Carnobacterium sp. ISL-102]|uniref:ROK family transcriptional regulator n=1 Tax=Carnobacterium sp. ISL-102 TaxID=2819142 RepID=UPI001BE6FA21|nr:ROK family transcriptional regulator [Carnobacterium sp. ISL-102]MBT2732461.1 ROK family protein [Carnobacterium sp. ISL-102]